jgi:hypothetical protein
MPGPCHDLVLRGEVGHGQVLNCLGQNGWRQVVTYQPANRFWTFQSIEAALFLALAAVLVTASFVIAARRDA